MAREHPTHAEFACGMWAAACIALGIPQRDWTEVAGTLRGVLAPWGSRPLGDRPSYPSYVSHAGLPLELSVHWSAHGPQVRVVWEALGDPARKPDPRSCLRAGQESTRRLAHLPGVSLDRYQKIEELFLDEDPASGDRPDPHTAVVWNSLGWLPGGPPVFGAYFNTQIRGPGEACAVVGEAMSRLGLAAAWQPITGRYPRLRRAGHRIQGFALDLLDVRQARAKVYFVHEEATLDDVQAVAGLSASHSAEKLSNVYSRVLCTGASGGMPPATCLAFTSGHDRPVSANVYLPIEGNVRDDAQAASIVTGVLTDNGISPSAYTKLTSAFAPRPLDRLTGLHKYLSCRTDAGSPDTTVYLRLPAYEDTLGTP